MPDLRMAARRCASAAALALALAATAGAEVTHAPFGHTRDGQPVERYVLRNRAGMQVSVLTLGGAIQEIRVPDREGHVDNVVLGLADVAAYEANPFFGTIVGRYANRITHGGFSIDGVRYPLSAQPDAIVSHGGSPGFARRVWSAQPCRRRGCTSLVLRYLSPDGESGFPGALDVTVTFTLEKANALRLDYAATTSRATVINLAQHPYFNLAGSGAGGIEDQRIRIAAAAFTPIDARQAPTGEIAAVTGTPLDLRRFTRFGDRIHAAHPQIAIAGGFNHNFVVIRRFPRQLAVAAEAYDPLSGRSLRVMTDQPGVQLYTANDFSGRLVGLSGRSLKRFAGFALETQHFPDSPNVAGFPSTVLRPGERFTSTTTFRFTISKRQSLPYSARASARRRRHDHRTAPPPKRAKSLLQNDKNKSCASQS